MLFFGRKKKKLAEEKAKQDAKVKEEEARKKEEEAKKKEKAEPKAAAKPVKEVKKEQPKTEKKEVKKEEKPAAKKEAAPSPKKETKEPAKKETKHAEEVKEEKKEVEEHEDHEDFDVEVQEKTRKAVYRVVYDKEDRLWKIKKDGAKRVIESFVTKEEVLARVQELAESQDSKFIVHKKDGKFQKKTNLNLKSTDKGNK